MLIIPKKTKFKKVRKGRVKNGIPYSNSLKLGKIGLIAIESTYLKASQLEAARQTINRHLQRLGRVWITVFPDLGITKRPTQVRIGKGTGSIKYWACRVSSGTVIFEVDGVPLSKAYLALKSGAHKLPLKLKLIRNNE